MNKAQLRNYFLEKRKHLLPEKCLDMNKKIAKNFSDFLKLKNKEINYLHIYFPILGKNEVDTALIIKHIQKNYPTIILVVSKSNFTNCSMQHFEYTYSTILIENNYGILEPANGIEIPSEKIDMVIVPLVVIDKNGHRIGYGKGFYDHFLAECKTSCLKIGLSFDEPIDSIPNDTYDIPLDICITPSEITFFK